MLRERGSEGVCQLIGEAYVRGVMRREALSRRMSWNAGKEEDNEAGLEMGKVVLI